MMLFFLFHLNHLINLIFQFYNYFMNLKDRPKTFADDDKQNIDLIDIKGQFYLNRFKCPRKKQLKELNSVERINKNIWNNNRQSQKCDIQTLKFTNNNSKLSINKLILEEKSKFNQNIKTHIQLLKKEIQFLQSEDQSQNSHKVNINSKFPQSEDSMPKQYNQIYFQPYTMNNVFSSKIKHSTIQQKRRRIKRLKSFNFKNSLDCERSNNYEQSNQQNILFELASKMRPLSSTINPPLVGANYQKIQIYSTSTFDKKTKQERIIRGIKSMSVNKQYNINNALKKYKKIDRKQQLTNLNFHQKSKYQVRQIETYSKVRQR